MKRPDLITLRAYLRYEPDTGDFYWVKRPGPCSAYLPGHKAGHFHKSTGYTVIGLRGGIYLAHQLAWLWVYESWPDQSIDHKDRNRRNNAIANLRLATCSQNAANIKIVRSASGVKGVTFLKKYQRWQASIKVNGRNVYLGMHESKETAGQAYAEAAKRYFGEYAA